MKYQSLKILILASYYQRPKLLRNAMNSLLVANESHSNWSMVFIDDGSDIPGEPIVRDVLADHVDKIDFVQTGMTFEDKAKLGLILGQKANEGMENSDADVVCILCDDDELHPDYLKNLSSYFTDHPEVDSCYSKVLLFNPVLSSSSNASGISNIYNSHEGLINPAGKVDASQVAWRLSCYKEKGARFCETTKSDTLPMIRDIDRSFFQSLYDCCGDCHPTGFVAQYKGIHDYQLLWKKSGTEDQLREYDQICKEKGGIEF